MAEVPSCRCPACHGVGIEGARVLNLYGLWERPVFDARNGFCRWCGGTGLVGPQVYQDWARQWAAQNRQQGTWRVEP